jgi:RNA polymerase sigma-70 factor (ECF subfamily)
MLGHGVRFYDNCSPEKGWFVVSAEPVEFRPWRAVAIQTEAITVTPGPGDNFDLELEDNVREATEPTEAAAAADATAFASLLATAERTVFLYAMSLLHRADDAEEVLQRTRVIVWQKFSQYERGTDFIRWACAIARLEALKIREEFNREKRLFRDAFLEVLACEAERSLDILEARRQALETCLGKLRQEDRNLILRRYQRGATTQSVAKALNRSPQGTRRSLQRLREALAECVRRTLALEND